MDNKPIFGRSWSDIQDVQMKRYKTKFIKLGHHVPQQPTNVDIDLLHAHGIDGLKEKKMYGVLERLGNAGYDIEQV